MRSTDTMLAHQKSALDILLGLATDTSVPSGDRLSAAACVLSFNPYPFGLPSIDGGDRFELTPEAEAALAAEVELNSTNNLLTQAATVQAEAEKPKRTRRSKAEMEAARAAQAAIEQSTAESVEQIGRAITDTPEDRTDEGAEAEDVHEASDSDADSVDWDNDEPAEAEPFEDTHPITKDEVVALLNRYAAKHPKKAQGAKDVLAKFGSTSLKDISPGEYNAVAAELNAFLQAA